MGQFVDPTATRDLPIGACLCPGTPHDGDTITVRELSWAEKNDLGLEALGVEGTGKSGHYSLTETKLALFRRIIVGWNFVDEAGEPVSVTPEMIARLSGPAGDAIADALDKLAEGEALPNASSAPSADTSSGSASPIPMNRAQRRSTRRRSS